MGLDAEEHSQGKGIGQSARSALEPPQFSLDTNFQSVSEEK